MKALVIGGTGFLGSYLVRSLEATAADRRFFDLSQPPPPILGDYTHVIICGGITDVEKCYQEPKLSERVNITGTIELLNLIRKSGAKPIFFSSDYVFGLGKAPFAEDDPKNPQTIYGQQKLQVERYIEQSFNDYLILRTSKLMAKFSHSRNILSPVVERLSRSEPVKCFTDQWVNPVFIEDVAQVVQSSIKKNLVGTFHLGTRQVYSRQEMGELLAEAFGFSKDLVQPIKIADLKFSEPRSHHNTISCSKIEKALGFHFCELQDALVELKGKLRHAHSKN